MSEPVANKKSALARRREVSSLLGRRHRQFCGNEVFIRLPLGVLAVNLIGSYTGGHPICLAGIQSWHKTVSWKPGWSL